MTGDLSWGRSSALDRRQWPRRFRTRFQLPREHAAARTRADRVAADVRGLRFSPLLRARAAVRPQRAADYRETARERHRVQVGKTKKAHLTSGLLCDIAMPGQAGAAPIDRGRGWANGCVSGVDLGHDLLGMGHFFLVLHLPLFLEGVSGLLLVFVFAFVS